MLCFLEENRLLSRKLQEMDTDVSGIIMADDYKLSLIRFRYVVKNEF